MVEDPALAQVDPMGESVAPFGVWAALVTGYHPCFIVEGNQKEGGGLLVPATLSWGGTCTERGPGFSKCWMQCLALGTGVAM
jgi:hypothetical protein